MGLRNYQWEGVTWLTNLRLCGLSGLLADEMGLGELSHSSANASYLCDLLLGKTVQSLAAVVACRVLCSESPVKGATLVICPASVVVHWETEITKYFKSGALRPIQFANLLRQVAACSSSVVEEDSYESALHGLSGNDAVIISYAKFLKEISLLQCYVWGTVILDEAHVIKNPKSRTAEAVFKLQAHQRIAISGTPLQNNVHELWSIFNFLLPGYLGEYSNFRAEYILPILRSHRIRSNVDNMGKNSSISVEGLAKLKQLHKMVCRLLNYNRLRCFSSCCHLYCVEQRMWLPLTCLQK